MNFRFALSITSIFILFGFSLLGQTQKSFQVELNWENVQNLGEKNARIRLMHFEDAIGSEQYSELPAYFHQVELSSNNSIDVRIKQVQFEVLNDSICALFPSLDNISSEFVITTSIYSARGNNSANIFVETLRKRNNKTERLLSFNLITTSSPSNKISGNNSKGKTYINHSVLSKGQWYKIHKFLCELQKNKLKEVFV